MGLQNYKITKLQITNYKLQITRLLQWLSGNGVPCELSGFLVAFVLKKKFKLNTMVTKKNTSSQLKTLVYLLPITDYQLPITDYQLP